MGFADRIRALFKKTRLDEEVFEDLADLLVEGDIGAAFAFEIVDKLRDVCRKERKKNSQLIAGFTVLTVSTFRINTVNLRGSWKRNLRI